MSENPLIANPFLPLLSSVMQVQDVTWGAGKNSYRVRYRGRLTMESSQAYELLSDALASHQLIPVFKESESIHIVTLLDAPPSPTKNKIGWNVLMFLLTVISMLFAGAAYVYEGSAVTLTELYLELGRNLATGIPFAASLLSILLVHEFGHYFAARFHKTPVSLPYFLPMPFPSSFGTLGAFIQLKAAPKNKRVLHDIGLAGPLFGLMVCIPILLYGISLSEVTTLPESIPAGSGLMLEGNSIFYLISKFLVKGQWLPSPASYQGTVPILYWLKFLISGLPTPLGGSDIQMHPIAWAGWVGLLVTALNLIPIGQLDGGHMAYVLFGEKVKKAVPVLITLLAVLGFLWQGWWVWAMLLSLMGRSHAEPLDQITPLNRLRKFTAVLSLVIFILLFTPVPLRVLSGPYIGP